MNNISSTKRYNPWISGGLALFLSLTGCSPQDYKEKADTEAYTLIDQKWDERYGSKVNYKISDTEPSAGDLQIEKIIPASGILTLPQAVAIATAHNRQYQTEKEFLYSKALDLRLAIHDFDPQYFGGASGGYVKAGDNESVGAMTGLGFNQLLASGARLSTDVTVAWTDILTGDARGGLRTLWNTAITQPLLRGSDSRIVMENLTQAQRDTVYQIRSFNRFRQTLAVSIISQYYRVLQQSDRVQTTQANLETLKQVHQRAQKLVDAGRLPRFELNEAYQDELKAKDEYLQAQADYKQILDEFKIALSLPTTAEFRLDENELYSLNILDQNTYSMAPFPAKQDLASEELPFPEEERELIGLIDFDEGQNELDKQRQDVRSYLVGAADLSEPNILETALALRMDLANQADAIADAERKILVAADNLRAEMNLTANSSLSTRGSSDHLAGVGMELDLPLERMAEANEYRRSLIVLTQQKRAYEEAVDNVSLQVRQAHRNFVEAAERYQVQLEGLELAKIRFKNTFLLLQYSRANTRDVLDAQEDLYDAQNAAAEALINHTIAMLDFYRDTGVLQIRPDGMWEL